MKITRKLCLFVSVMMLSCAVLTGCGAKDPTPSAKVELPTASSGKHPSQYTWQAYLAMSEEQKEAFRKSFGRSTWP